MFFNIPYCTHSYPGLPTTVCHHVPQPMYPNQCTQPTSAANSAVSIPISLTPPVLHCWSLVTSATTKPEFLRNRTRDHINTYVGFTYALLCMCLLQITFSPTQTLTLSPQRHNPVHTFHAFSHPSHTYISHHKPKKPHTNANL